MDQLTEPLGGTSSERVQQLAADLRLLIAAPVIESRRRSNKKKKEDAA
jgi:hypothetical protein